MAGTVVITGASAGRPDYGNEFAGPHTERRPFKRQGALAVLAVTKRYPVKFDEYRRRTAAALDQRLRFRLSFHLKLE
jgi:hypothetical protein